MTDTTRELYDLLTEDQKHLIDNLVFMLVRGKQVPEPSKAEHMTVLEAADKYNVSRNAVYRAISRGDLVAVSPVGQTKPLFVTRANMEGWLYGARPSQS